MYFIACAQAGCEKVFFLRLFKGSRGRGFLATTKLFGTGRTAASL
jgi:hypothetical protein